MNNTDRKRLYRLQLVLLEIPFSASGTATSTGYGAIMFEQDMRAVRPYIAKALEGMALDGVANNELDKGWDYDDPDLLLDALEAWVAQRKAASWQNATEYSFQPFYKDYQAKARQE